MLESGAAGGRKTREPSLFDAIITLGSLIVLIAGCLLIFGLDALDGPLQVALLLACMVAVFVGVKNGYRAVDIQLSGERAISSVTSALFILLAVGALIGTWNLSGTIATMVYYGIQVLAPGVLLPRRRGDLRGGLPQHRQLVDDRRHHRRRPGRHRRTARRLPGHHGRRGDLRRVPRRQALAALRDHCALGPAREGRHLPAHPAAGMDIPSGLHHRRDRLHDPRTGRSGQRGRARG